MYMLYMHMYGHPKEKLSMKKAIESGRKRTAKGTADELTEVTSCSYAS